MTQSSLHKSTLRGAGSALALTLAMGAAQASTNPFQVTELDGGYQVALAGEHMCGEGKCGEGKCGASKAGEAKCGEAKCGEGKCGAS
ncbi:MAG: hypothetical protein ABF296_12640, partial [Oceanococcaceae bacterium]